VPAAKSSQDSSRLRVGVEKPRAITTAFASGISHRRRHSDAVRGLPQTADSIGFGVVFPYMGLRRLLHARRLRPHAKPLCLDNCSQFPMTSASELRSGKGHRDENFPVASWIIHPRHRALILAFYNFVRTADDIADHATLPAPDKLAFLDLLEAELLGKGDTQPEAVNLRRALAERSMPPRHALDVLVAFRMDVTKLRYENWDEVIHYCRYSAMPVGRFMLDVHGESTSTWAASDALCAGLQINNHLQDCGKDYHDLNRVYLPRDALEAAGATVEALGAGTAPASLLQCLHSLAARTQLLLNGSKSLAAEVKDFRLGLEIAVIQAFADRIVRLLKVRDPLSERVHLNPIELIAFSIGGVAGEMTRRAIGLHPQSKPAAGA
jgi:squalene synthase HpnC